MFTDVFNITVDKEYVVKDYWFVVHDVGARTPLFRICLQDWAIDAVVELLELTSGNSTRSGAKDSIVWRST